ncbi:uncharacterized protein LOC143075962 [Mytilus galloprovincialis]|uniref:uncharacterized protein LOC143075962 n=1 Tax=Mytilus galloprovincialis TaxID=29158 RepID=UPI003F7BAEDA
MRQTRKCQSPTHPDQSAAKPSRGIPASVCKELWMTKRISLPVGSGKFNDSSERLFTTETGISNAEESDNLAFTNSECDFPLSSQDLRHFPRPQPLIGKKKTWLQERFSMLQ